MAVERTDGRVTVGVTDGAPPIPDIEAEVLTGDYEMNDVYHSSGLWLVYWVAGLSDGSVTVSRSASGENQVRLRLPEGE